MNKQNNESRARLWTLLFLGLLGGYGPTALADRQPVDRQHVFPPVAQAWIRDSVPQFDGIGDADGIKTKDSPGAELWTVNLMSGIADGHAVAEFNVRQLKFYRIKNAFLTLPFVGSAANPGVDNIPVQLFGYLGNGIIQTDDFNEGAFITVFDAGLSVPHYVPITLDVTKFLKTIFSRPQEPVTFVGFSMRTNVSGVSINFGSMVDTSPTLTVIYN